MADRWHRVPCANGACAELAHLPDGGVRLRSSLRPQATITLTRGEWQAFRAAIQAGEYDNPAPHPAPTPDHLATIAAARDHTPVPAHQAATARECERAGWIIADFTRAAEWPPSGPLWRTTEAGRALLATHTTQEDTDA